MQGKAVLEILRRKGISRLHHSNTVTTACTSLGERGLASRGYVADRKLPQTPQYSDTIDTKYGIMHDVFLDTADIHQRASRRNQYGPVMFVLDAEMLGRLDDGDEVLVTRKNPTKWVEGESAEARYFTTSEELDAGLVKGEFDQIVTIKRKSGILPFVKVPVELTVDDPKRHLADGRKAVDVASDRLKAASAASSTSVSISARTCSTGCKCNAEYDKLPTFETQFK